MSSENSRIIRLTDRMSSDEKRNAVRHAMFLGFQSLSANFPVTSRSKGQRPNEQWQECSFGVETKAPEGYLSASKKAVPIAEYDWRKRQGLESLFLKGEFLKDRNLDLLPDVMDFQIILPDDASLSVVAAACDLAFRFGMETTAYEGEIVTAASDCGNRIVFDNAKECRMWLEETTHGKVVHFCGSGSELEKFASELCGQFPFLDAGFTFVERLQELTDGFCMDSLDGQLAMLESSVSLLEGNVKAYVSPGPGTEKKMKSRKEQFPEVEFHNYKGMREVYRREYEIPWEVDTFYELLEKRLYPKLRKGDQVEIYSALSEDLEMRHKVSEAVRKELKKRAVKTSKLELLCAYKQGYSWIEEIVLPEAVKCEVKAVQIAFQPFLPEGVTEWLDEDGATPSYNNVKGDTPDKWYDLPIRYLQELYPVEDVIADQLQIDREQILFTTYDGTEDITYEIKLLNQEQKEVYKATYKAVCHERPYLDEFPQMGKVHPATGYLKVLVNGEVVINERIATDVEQIWDIYQKQVLPDCRTFIAEKTGGELKAECQPFFSQLKLEITASEPDKRLSSREDLISTLDALHEDLYFVGSDYFKNYGVQQSGVLLDAPGLILPVIHKGNKKPEFCVTLYDAEKETPCIVSETKQIVPSLKREDLEVFISEISFAQGSLCPHIRVNLRKTPAQDFPIDTFLSAYAKLLECGLLDMNEQLAGIRTLVLETEITKRHVVLPDRTTVCKDLSITEIDLLEETVIGYEQYLEIIEQLKRVAGISVFRAAVSYQGREIYAIELLPTASGYHSRTKRLTMLPSELINARHHANEVSGTNAAFILLKKLLTDEAYCDLADRINLVLVPMENVDGAALHYELQKEHPFWKLHVARFNAVGKEFYHEHFKADTIHTEALALTRLWNHYLPDIIADNHGVPSHEWEQQFSGYTSPSYKGFWLPRSLLYGYFWYVTDEAYKSNYAVNKKMEDVIADAISSDPDMKAANEEWMERFGKFAHQWMPKLFPANYYKEMINYWIPFAFAPEHRYPSIRFPWITTVAYTSEVADETAQGAYLNLCARTHVTHDLAAIQMLLESKSIFDRSLEEQSGGVSIRCIRQRPLIV